jgi:KDO2-lipid IV(A) lauroyltransferase
MLRDGSHHLQAIALRGAAIALQYLSPVQSSNLGAWITRTLGPLLPVSKIADSNLRHAFPEMSAAERATVINAVWDNLGRVVGELPHLATLRKSTKGPGWEIEGEEHIELLKATGAQALFFSGHLGNWEMILPIASSLGLAVAGFYRPASNKRADLLIQPLRERALNQHVSMFRKGPEGARAALLHLQSGGSLGLLIDQKMNDGISVPFFGRSAMTAPALAQLALRFHVPIIPVHVVRLGPARFRMVCEPPLIVSPTGDKKTDTYMILRTVNATLERWIRADPASWLWLHRRWPK